MKFPVFVLGLVVVSAGIGTMLWMSGVSAAMGLLWAMIAFAVGQILYVILIAMLAAAAKKSPHVAPKTQETAGAGPGRRLTPKQDQQV